MPEVHVLDKELAELIAAGEVIERPCSVIKELVENSIDSGAGSVTVEIKQGGISYIRITDNGCGMSADDVPIAFMRHATSKLSVKEDLSHIMTLGFRGEALASICAVSRCEVLTKRRGDEYGTHYIIEGTEEKLCEKTGCPDGTTFIVRDIFYNVPARLKFLKKDKYEGNAVASVMSRIALSHPEISFRFIRNNNQELFTPGDSRLYSAVYSVFGKEFAAALIPVSYRFGGIGVKGYTVKPLWGRKNRTMQYFFINGRNIRSLTCMCALEEAYRNCIMEGKFPACVLFMDIDPQTVDVNVHPAKTEVRFSDDKAVYDALYFAVKNALLADSKPAELKIPERRKTAEDYALPVFSDPPVSEQTAMEDTSNSKYAGTVIPAASYSRDAKARREEIGKIKSGKTYFHEIRTEKLPENFDPFGKALRTDKPEEADMANGIKDTSEAEAYKSQPHSRRTDLSQHLQSSYEKTESSANDISELVPEQIPENQKQDFKYINSSSFTQRKVSEDPVKSVTEPPKEIYFRIIGEAFKNYAIAETEDGILIVDKHAAHERINFERLRTGREHLSCQMLLSPEELLLDYAEYDALVRNLGMCSENGFEIEPLDAPRVLIKGIPSMLHSCGACDIVSELAQNFAAHKHDPLPEILDDMFHTIACRSSVRANDVTGIEELKYLVEQILSDERIRYCPHGRPVMFNITKKELEKQFRRIV